jgi:hypothetical protein
MIAVIQTFVYPQAWTDHFLWVRFWFCLARSGSRSTVAPATGLSKLGATRGGLTASNFKPAMERPP